MPDDGTVAAAPSSSEPRARDDVALDGKRDCAVELGDPDTLISIESWGSLARRLAARGEFSSSAVPRSNEAARRRLCKASGCTGTGPWIVSLADPKDPALSLLAVVMPDPSGRLVTLVGDWYQNSDWACAHKNGLEAQREPTTAAVHIRVVRRDGVGAWHSCLRPDSDDGCKKYCREVSVVSYDWFLQPETLATIAIVTRTQLAGAWEGEEDRDLIPDASATGSVIELSVEGHRVVVDGCGARLELDLEHE